LQIDLGRSSPLRRVLNNRQQLDGLTDRRQRAVTQQVRLLHAHAQGAAQRLQALNPLAVLQRGFAVVSDSEGKLIRIVAQAQAGQRLRIQVSDGTFHARTEPET
jgi:exodeoxyribonuclease VII large subunit